jgi:hypothetical protein
VTTCLSCDRETPAGEYLCQPCTTRVDRQLTDLPALYGALGAYLRPSSQVSAAVGSSCPAPDAPLPVREDALDLVGPGGIVTALEDWRFELCQDAEIHWHQPFGDYTGRLRRVVRSLRDQLPYISGHWPSAGEFADAVRVMHSSARSVVAPQERPLRAGNCTAEVEAGACGAVLLVLPGEPVKCRWCGAEYPAASWLDLAAKRTAA